MIEPACSAGSQKPVSAARNAFSILWLNQNGDPEVRFLRVFPANGHDYFTPLWRAATVSLYGSCASWMRARFSSVDLGSATFMDRALQSTSCKKYWLPYFVKTTLP